MKLRIFYDNHCPLCVAEMRQLKALDENQQLELVALNEPEFIHRYPYIDPIKASRKLHGELNNGELLLGLDVTCTAWSLVGKHKWLKMLRWPGIRYLADGVYLLFARYRSNIAYLLTGKTSCESCSLDINQKNCS